LVLCGFVGMVGAMVGASAHAALGLGLLICVQGEAELLTEANFQELVIDGQKNSFVKYQAPW